MIEWTMANWPYIVAVLLAISELMAVIPKFQGNGILDAIIKILQTAAKKGA